MGCCSSQENYDPNKGDAKEVNAQTISDPQ